LLKKFSAIKRVVKCFQILPLFEGLGEGITKKNFHMSHVERETILQNFKGKLVCLFFFCLIEGKKIQTRQYNKLNKTFLLFTRKNFQTKFLENLGGLRGGQRKRYGEKGGYSSRYFSSLI
jgi:hypothetical protein